MSDSRGQSARDTHIVVRRRSGSGSLGRKKRSNDDDQLIFRGQKKRSVRT